MNYTETDIEKLDRIFRLNLINAVTGSKAANLIGTISDAGLTNLAKINDVSISGLNSYYALEKIADFPYARVEKLPDFSKVE